MKKFLLDHPKEKCKKTLARTSYTNSTISRVKNVLGVFFFDKHGHKHVHKISCANCREYCFSPMIETEAVPADPPRQGQKRRGH